MKCNINPAPQKYQNILPHLMLNNFLDQIDLCNCSQNLKKSLKKGITVIWICMLSIVNKQVYSCIHYIACILTLPQMGLPMGWMGWPTQHCGSSNYGTPVRALTLRPARAPSSSTVCSGSVVSPRPNVCVFTNCIVCLHASKPRRDPSSRWETHRQHEYTHNQSYCLYNVQ